MQSEKAYAKFLLDDRYEDCNCVIYRFKNIANGKVYIGQTIKSARRRVIQHMTNSRAWTNAHKTYFHNALNKYGFNGFEFSIIEICSAEELNEREVHWIKHYKATDKNYGYNIDSGGSSGKTTAPLSEEHKLALLKANLGRKRKNETKRKISIAHRERFKNNPELIIENSVRLKKYSDSLRIPIYQYSMSGLLIKKWESLVDVAIILYGKKRQGSTLHRNIKNNMKKQNKFGFSKNGSIWSTLSPKEGRAY